MVTPLFAAGLPLAAAETETPLMPSKFAQFLEKNKIDPRRLLATSRGIERLRREDRSARLGKRQAKAAGTPAAAAAADGEKKPKRRSGRPVTPRLVQAAQLGKPVPGPGKTRLLRALNRILEQKKQEPVDLRTVF
ncbi:MAG TPA: hypothetical protein VER33_03915 [Polyangiaceae bacterium]|nr:hypothetical protein [Polyangiaceae bacterium]